jgi:hypothetical protein
VQVRLVLAGCIVVISLVVAANFAGGNRWIARRSLPLATYTTFMPVPLNIRAAYRNGSFQGVKVGSSVADALSTLGSTLRCRVMRGDSFVSLDDARYSQTEDGEMVLLCRKAGLAWNIVLALGEGKVREIRLAGGAWL